MEVNCVINKVLCDMCEQLSQEQLAKLKECLILTLHEYVDSESTYITDVVYDVNEVIQNYKIYLVMGYKSQKTIRQYIYNIKKFLDKIGKPYNEVTSDDIKYYLYYRQCIENISPITVDNERKQCAVFYKWALDNGYITKNPFSNVEKVKVPDKEKVVLSDQEIEMVRDSCDTPRELALIDFLLATGVRVNECVNIKINDIDFLKHEVKIYGEKTNKWRKVYIDAKCEKHLLEYIDSRVGQSSYLFSSDRNCSDKLSCSTVERIIHKVVGRTKIDKQVTVHTFRKTLASRLHRKGMVLENIAMILGHTSTNTTNKYYLIIDEERVRQEYSRFVA